MKALVTGGAGFIGSHLVDALVERGDEVIVVDDMSTGKAENLNPKATFYKNSITDPEVMLQLTEGVEAIFHLAAWARVQRSVDDPIGTNHVNVDGTLNLLNVARIHGVERFIYSSSSSVYGEQTETKMYEEMTPRPMHPYGLQKLIGEQYCHLFYKLFNLHTVSLRYFNVYGTRQVTEGAYSLVIGKFLAQKAKGEPMTIYGDGTQTRAYTHVSDVVRANLLAYEKGWSGEAYNIGTGVETSVNQIAEMLGGETVYITPNPRGQFEEKRKCADYTRAELGLGWKPLVSIKQGVAALL